jgi:limonene-1,2-epoxide hydrolase
VRPSCDGQGLLQPWRITDERNPDATDDLWRAVKAFAAGERGSVVLGYGTSAGYETPPRLLEAIADYEPGSVSLEVTGMVAEGDQVTLEWTSRARTIEGAPYENFCIGVFTLRDGRIAAVREYMDTGYARRTGVRPAPLSRNGEEPRPRPG